MKPIPFKQQNQIIAKDQPQYLPLPAHIGYINEEHNYPCVTFCWQLSLKERIKILFNGILWHRVITFRQPLQPVLLDLNKPSFYE